MRRLRVNRIALSAVALGLLTFPLVVRVQAADTGFLSPTAQAADTGGAGNGFEVNPTYAFADDAAFAGNINGAGDRHRYFNYGASIPAGAFIHGIEVRLDWRLDSTSGNNNMRVELSWDGGVSWTSPKTDARETTSQHTAVLGGPTEPWGRDWAPSELSNANFRVRLTSICTSSSSCSNRDFFLDWVAVKIYFSPVGQNPSLTASCGNDMVLVIDGSASISAAEYAQMQAALVGFVDAFTGTPTEYALVEFATGAIVRRGFTDDAAAMISEINEARVQPGGSYTNWDDGLFDARSLFPHRSNPDLIVFASDGNPNRRGGHTALGHNAAIRSVNESAAMEWAIQEANAAKGAGLRIVALGIGGGSGEAEALDLQNLIAISGPNVAVASGEITIGTDVVLASFDTLGDALAQLALELCGGSLDLYILDIDDELAGDELIFNLVAENMLPGEMQTWTLSLRNDGTLPWDLDPLSDIDTSLSSGWSCEGDPAPEFSVMFTPILQFPDGVDDHDGLIHVEPGGSQSIHVEVTLELSAENDCQGKVFNLVAMFTATQHLP